MMRNTAHQQLMRMMCVRQMSTTAAAAAIRLRLVRRLHHVLLMRLHLLWLSMRMVLQTIMLMR